MKNQTLNNWQILILILIFCPLIHVFAQSPLAIPYQAVARNQQGVPLANQSISVKLNVRNITASGAIIYSEQHAILTNELGLFTINIGNGSVLSGNFNSIDWGNGSKFLQVEFDPAGGSSFVNMGTTQLLSVPYALFSNSTSNAWSLGGNNITDANTQYIGSNSGQPIKFKLNGVSAGEISIDGTSLGFGALFSNTSGIGNTAIGNTALGSLVNGDNNVALGYAAQNQNTSGARNVAIGAYSSNLNVTGKLNTAIGDSSLYSNLMDENTSFGASSLKNNVSGTNNTAVGVKSLYKNVNGFWNSSFGFEALRNNLSNANTAFGAYSLKNNTSGTGNVAMGANALLSNVNANGNTAIGQDALKQNTSGNNNSAVGSTALSNNTVGTQNTAMGRSSLSNNNSGSFNTSIGNNSLNFNTSGTGNVALGYKSLENNNAGNNNTSIGNQAAVSQNQYSECTFLGVLADANTNSISNSTAIGASAVVTASNQIRIGNAFVTSIGGFANWTNVSDKRFKKNINYNSVPGLQFINKLKPVSYNLDINAIQDKLGKKSDLKALNSLQTGFIAQEVEQAAKDCGFDFSGIDHPENDNDYYGLRYAEFTVPLVKAVQELYQINASQSIEIELLKKQIEELSKHKN